jgi:hypothetical protein
MTAVLPGGVRLRLRARLRALAFVAASLGVGSISARGSADAGASASAGTSAGGKGGAAPAVADTVRVQILVDPPHKAHVFWGLKDFGVAPLEIERPRGSGPLDLVVRAPGFLVFHTRAFTEHDDRIYVHLTAGEPPRPPRTAPAPKR